MNRNTDIAKKSADGHLSGDLNSECPERWVIHCIACEKPVEPWQTSGYEFGFCAACFETVMNPPGRS